MRVKWPLLLQRYSLRRFRRGARFLSHFATLLSGAAPSHKFVTFSRPPLKTAPILPILPGKLSAKQVMLV